MTITARCHCGRTVIEVEGDIPAELTRCTCSFCSKRGHLFAYFRPEQMRVKQADSDGIYRWQTRKVDHHFCSACGCGTYSDSPDFKPDGSWDGTSRRIGLNARLIDDFEAADWPVTVIDGKKLW
jgi:hypothetical protein